MGHGRINAKRAMEHPILGLLRTIEVSGSMIINDWNPWPEVTHTTGIHPRILALTDIDIGPNDVVSTFTWDETKVDINIKLRLNWHLNPDSSIDVSYELNIYDEGVHYGTNPDPPTLGHRAWNIPMDGVINETLYVSKRGEPESFGRLTLSIANRGRK